jgi:hypothetical protein
MKLIKVIKSVVVDRFCRRELQNQPAKKNKIYAKIN